MKNILKIAFSLGVLSLLYWGGLTIFKNSLLDSKRKLTAETNTLLISELSRRNQEIDFAHTFIEGDPKWDEVISKAIDNKGNNSYSSLVSGTEPSTAVLRGVSPTRGELEALVARLDGVFTEAHAPEESFSKQQDLIFTINIKI